PLDHYSTLVVAAVSYNTSAHLTSLATPSLLSLSFFFSHHSPPHPHLHSFPTRRSSDRHRKPRLLLGLAFLQLFEASVHLVHQSEIGRAHVLTPVTFRSRMPSSA